MKFLKKSPVERRCGFEKVPLGGTRFESVRKFSTSVGLTYDWNE
jgi:hypothetical protein